MRIGFCACLIPLTLIGGISSAAASGAVWCNVDDEAVTFAMRSGVSRGISGGFLNFTADLTTKLAGVPADFQNSRFNEAAITQHWLDEKEFRRTSVPSGERLHRVRRAHAACVRGPI